MGGCGIDIINGPVILRGAVINSLVILCNAHLAFGMALIVIPITGACCHHATVQCIIILALTSRARTTHLAPALFDLFAKCFTSLGELM